MSQGIDQKIQKCIRCGFCLDACPTFRLTGRETLSPRGRIYLVRSWREKIIPITEEVVEALDTCLGCRACETACPSGVEYGAILEMARAEIEATRQRPWAQAEARRAFVNLLTNPRLMAIALKAGGVLGHRQEGRIPSILAQLLSGTPRSEVRLPRPHGHVEEFPQRTPALGEKRYTVGILLGCVMRVLYPSIHVATVRVLQKNGCEVLVPPKLGCCGALHLHIGLLEEAKQRAKTFLDAIEPYLSEMDAFVVNSAGCGSTLKEYAALLENDPSYSERARTFAAKVRDISEWLIEIGLSATPNPLPIVVTYHDACHLAHAQRIRAQPRQLLQSIPHLRLVEMEEADTCCGSAGVYNVTQPEMARKLLVRKMEYIKATGANTVVTGNPGCLAWIEQGVTENGLALKVQHPIEVLEQAYLPPAER